MERVWAVLRSGQHARGGLDRGRRRHASGDRMRSEKVRYVVVRCSRYGDRAIDQGGVDAGDERRDRDRRAIRPHHAVSSGALRYRSSPKPHPEKSGHGYIL